MGLPERQEAIERLQQVRGSKVLVHFLSDRRVAQSIPIPGMNSQLAGEAYPLIYEHLRALGRGERLDLFLYTTGGHLDSVWAIVGLMRAMSERFSVLVPMKALSAGTLLCLGADEIVMHEAAHLSATDPSTANPFNPEKQSRPVPISVEDVTAFFDLAREGGQEGEVRSGAGLTSDEHMLEVFKSLASQVHPLALGNVKRAHSQIRAISARLLELHLEGDDAPDRIKKIVSTLTEELYSHGHVIGRDEATDILGADMVKVPSAEEAAAMWELYRQYEEFFELKNTFNLRDWLGGAAEQEFKVIGGVIESEATSHVFRAVSRIRQMSEISQGVQVQIPTGQRMPLIPGLPTKINIEPLREGWYANEEE